MKGKNDKVVVRFPPSPTGFFHIGGARTALFNYLFARKHKGKIFIRFENTDKERSRKEYEGDIRESLVWLGLEMDGEPVRQSERTELYKRYLKKLVDSGAAYVSQEKPATDNHQLTMAGKRQQKNSVIRFKNPGKKIKFTDLIRGEIEFDTAELKDFVIAKSPEEPLYHLAVVVDDFEMGVTHVIRGEDHISNTPRQILIQEAIGVPRPQYAHIPLILAPDRSKLSKRHGAVSVLEYKKMGYFPEALINYLALLGWNPGNNQEIFSLKKLIQTFDLEKVQKSGAIFNLEKLNWLNKEYLKKASLKLIEQKIKEVMPEMSPQTVSKLAPVTLERISRLGEIEEMKRAGEFDYFIKHPSFKPELLQWKGDKDLTATSFNLEHTKTILKQIDEKQFTKENLKSALWDFATEKGRGSVLWPLRIALSGKEKSPDPFTLAEIFGKQDTILRIDAAQAILTKEK